MIWCGLHANCIIEIYFLKNEAGAHVTFSGDLSVPGQWFFVLFITDGINPVETWFQNDEKFGDELILGNGSGNWFPR